MLPPILPSPTSPMSMSRASRSVTVGRADAGLALRTAGAAASAGSGSRCPRRPRAPADAGEHDRLGGLGERELHDGLVDRGQPVEQELRVEAGGDVLAVDRRPRSTRDACASSPEPASRVSTPSLKASWTAVLRSATRATRLTDSISAALSTWATVRCSLGNRLRTLGNSPSSSRVVVRRTPPAAAPSNPMMPSPRAAGGQRDRDLAAGGERLGGVAEHPGRHQRGHRLVGRARVPARARAGRAGTGRWRAARSSSRRSRSGRR